MFTPKTSTRQQRGTGIRRRVRPPFTTKIPGNLANLLRVDQTRPNKLFLTLAKALMKMVLPLVSNTSYFICTQLQLANFFLQCVSLSFSVSYGKQIFTTLLQDCASNPTGADLSLIAPCTHEEADSRMMLHNTAVYEGHRQVLVRISDSDVGVL